MSTPTTVDESFHTIPPRPSRSLAGKVAIVTGAGSRAAGLGNGRASAILLAEAGAKVVCSDINLENVQLTVSMIEKEFGRGAAIALQADVTNEEDCKKTVDLALSQFGRLDILVNNVGIVGQMGTAVDVDAGEWAKGLEVNLTSMVFMTKYAVPAMEKNEAGTLYGKGSIVNISSISGLMGGVPALLYPTSKGAIVNMTKAMAAHHGPSGIRVNCVCPGSLFTPMVYTAGISPEVRNARVSMNILRTEGNAWDCGAAVRFLASEEARWVTGVIMPVDAGAMAARIPPGNPYSTLTPK